MYDINNTYPPMDKVGSKEEKLRQKFFDLQFIIREVILNDDKYKHRGVFNQFLSEIDNILKEDKAAFKLYYGMNVQMYDLTEGMVKSKIPNYDSYIKYQRQVLVETRNKTKPRTPEQNKIMRKVYEELDVPIPEEYLDSPTVLTPQHNESSTPKPKESSRGGMLQDLENLEKVFYEFSSFKSSGEVKKIRRNVSTLKQHFREKTLSDDSIKNLIDYYYRALRDEIPDFVEKYDVKYAYKEAATPKKPKQDDKPASNITSKAKSKNETEDETKLRLTKNLRRLINIIKNDISTDERFQSSAEVDKIYENAYSLLHTHLPDASLSHESIETLTDYYYRALRSEIPNFDEEYKITYAYLSNNDPKPLLSNGGKDNHSRRAHEFGPY